MRRDENVVRTEAIYTSITCIAIRVDQHGAQRGPPFFFFFFFLVRTRVGSLG